MAEGDDTMDTQAAIRVLNRALSLEYAGVIQSLQAAALVQGPYRELHEKFFAEQSESAREHARKLTRWIVLLNGLPTVEPAPIRQSTDLTEMLRQGLELEREAHRAYLEALPLTADEPALRFFVEEMVQSERLDIDQFEKLLGQKVIMVATKEIKLKPA
jgi:bacterioferritin